MKREQWKSRLGFIWAAAGSAVGLGNIWRFPYVVGSNGGASFILSYLICLVLVGFPVLISEILIGRTTQKSPAKAFYALSRQSTWKHLGFVTILTGFLVTTFYGVISAVTLGYFFEALLGNITSFSGIEEAKTFYNSSSGSALWILLNFSLFTILSGAILFTGVKKGIEASNKILMPLLFIVLLVLLLKALSMPNSGRGIHFLFHPSNLSSNPAVWLVALGQAFFSLSLGQGTMVTYGSYVNKSESLPGTSIPITIFATAVSILSGMAIFGIVFSMGAAPDSGPSLMFETLPAVFSKMTGGYLLSISFLALLVMAGITSQISALEPLVAYLMDSHQMRRKKAVALASCSSFLIGIPSALSFGLLKNWTLFSMNFFDIVSYVCVNFLIPFGGFLAVILIGWKYGINKSIAHLEVGTKSLFKRVEFFRFYLKYAIKYIAPLLILLIFLDLLGLFSLFR